MHMTVYNFTINYEIRHTKESTRKRLYSGEYTIGGGHTQRVETGEGGARVML